MVDALFKQKYATISRSSISIPESSSFYNKFFISEVQPFPFVVWSSKRRWCDCLGWIGLVDMVDKEYEYDGSVYTDHTEAR